MRFSSGIRKGSLKHQVRALLLASWTVLSATSVAASQASGPAPAPAVQAQAPAPTVGDAPSPGGARAGVDGNGQLKDPGLQARFERIAKDLRCLVCQNESIADSNAELANELRRQVREMLVDGKSDAAIFDFMTDRYGEFVRFNPPFDAKTALIWGAPFILMLLGAFIVYRVVRHRSRMPLDDEPTLGSL